LNLNKLEIINSKLKEDSNEYDDKINEYIEIDSENKLIISKLKDNNNDLDCKIVNYQIHKKEFINKITYLDNIIKDKDI